jgi:hypothetical protein
MSELPHFPADPDLEFRLGDELEQRIKEKVYEAMEPAWERLNAARTPANQKGERI